VFPVQIVIEKKFFIKPDNGVTELEKMSEQENRENRE